MVNFKKTRIPLFRRFVLQNFPFIEQDFDALTDYELICKVVEYLNNVIVSTNANSEQVEILTDAFNDLQSYVDHYFDNLDVQEEINNKLDAMVEAGTLQEIVADYLNSKALFGYDTVADMKLATNLIDGSYAKTLGFTTKGDEGGATYKIRELGVGETANNIDLISLHDDIIAELITEPVMTTRQFGSGANTDVDVLTKALTACDVIILSDDLTIAPQQINISSNKVIDFNGHKLTMGDNNNISWANLIRVTGGHVTLKNGEIDGNSEGQTVAVVTNNTGVLVSAGSCTIDSMKIYNCLYEGVILNGHCTAEIDNTDIYDCGRNEIAVLSWDNLTVSNCTFDGTLTGGENISNIDIEPYEAGSYLGNANINNCIFKGNKLHAVSNYLDRNQTESANILISNCKFYNQLSLGYDRGRKSQYNIFNCIFESISDKPAIYIYETKENVNINNATIKNCATGIQCKLNYAWDVMKGVKINANFIGSITTAIEFVLTEGVEFTADNPFFCFDIDVTGSNAIKGWQFLHQSKIKTQALISTNNIALDFNHFYSDIYMTGYGKHIEIDPIYYKSKNIGVPFTIHTDVSNAIWSQKLPAIDENIGTYGTVAPSNSSSFSITIKNFNYDKFIIDSICGLHGAKNTQ